MHGNGRNDGTGEITNEKNWLFRPFSSFRPFRALTRAPIAGGDDGSARMAGDQPG
jgi:hypothetical protein